MKSKITNLALFLKPKKEICHYHLYEDGYRITPKPLDLNTIRVRFGSITFLERNGFRLIKSGSA